MADSPVGTQGIPTTLPYTEIQTAFFPYWQVSQPDSAPANLVVIYSDDL